MSALHTFRLPHARQSATIPRCRRAATREGEDFEVTREASGAIEKLSGGQDPEVLNNEYEVY